MYVSVVALLAVAAFGILRNAEAVTFNENEERFRGAVWLQHRQVLLQQGEVLPITGFFQTHGIPGVQDTLAKEITVVQDTTEKKSRVKFEQLCEIFPSTQGWTIYVRKPSSEFIFATTCPAG